MDQIQEDMMPVNHLKLTTQKIDLDLPGAGQHYCLHCALVAAILYLPGIGIKLFQEVHDGCGIIEETLHHEATQKKVYWLVIIHTHIYTCTYTSHVHYRYTCL